MKRKVIINRLPQADSGLSVKMNNLRAGLGFNANKMPWSVMAGQMSEPDVSVKKQLGPVPREFANLEAEKGETAMIPNKDGIPSTYTIGGKRHSQGGTPLNLPKDSFIFSDTAKMKIKDPEMLKRFGMPVKKGGYTPAEIAKKYDISEYRKILADKNTDKLQKETAERMIQNNNMKLAELALLQESMKGFPQGIPLIAMPYIIKTGFDPSFMFQPQEEVPEEDVQEEQYNEEMERSVEFGGIIGRLKQMKNGGLPRYAEGDQVINRIRRTDTVRLDPRTGEYGVYNIAGKKIGVMNVPNQANPRGQVVPYPMYPNMYPGMYPNQVAQTTYQPGAQTTTTAPATKTEVTTTKTTKTKSELPSDAIIVTSSDDEKITLDNVKAGKIYIKQENGKYAKATGFAPVSASKSGFENYKPIGESVEADLERAEGILAKLEKAGKAQKGSNTKGEKGWIIGKDAYEVLSLDDIEFMTRISSVGGPNYKKLGFRTPEGKGFDIVLQNKGKVGSYGWAHPKFMEYQYWKGLSPNNYQTTAEEYEKLMKENPDLMVENRKNMLKFYGFDVSKFDETKLKQPAEAFYTSDIINGKPDAKAVREGNRLVNGNEIGLVRATQEIFKDAGYRPALKSDNFLGLEHLELIKPGVTWGEAADSFNETVEKTSTTDDGPKTEKLKTPNVEFGAPWWLQDIIKVAGAAGDYARLKNYYPWQAEANVVTPDVTFYDPNQELNAAAAQSAIAANSLAQFTGAQAYNARYADLQGRQAENAANILGRYNNLNVGVSNEQAAQNANIYNQAAQMKAARDTSLWDKYQTVNQEFDNSKAKARETLRNQYVNAITNKAYTANLNTLTPQFAVDPSIGGEMIFKNPREIFADPSKKQTYQDVFNELMDNPNFQSDPGKTMEVAYKIWSGQPLYTSPFDVYGQNPGIAYPGMQNYQGRSQSSEG